MEIKLLLTISVVVLICNSTTPSALAQTAGNGVTHLRVTSQVILPAVTRLGINLGEPNYFDSGQMLKNLLSRNPGFESMTSLMESADR